MKKLVLRSGLLLVAVSLFVVSCVNKEYDITELNKEMTIGASGLAIPLGSTKQLKVSDFLDSIDVSFLSKDESGAFSIKVEDSLSLSEYIPDLSDMISFEGVEFSTPYNFSLDGLNQDISTEAMSLDYDFSLGDEGIMKSLELEPVSIEEKISAGLVDLLPGEDELSLDLENMEYIKDHIYRKDAIAGLDIPAGVEVSIPEGLLPNTNLEKKTYELTINLTLPDGISSVSEVMLNPNAKVKCDLSVIDPFLTKGSIVPAIDIDLSSLLEIEGGDEPIHLSELVLNEGNNYTVSGTYDVTAFKFDPSEWEGTTLSITKNVDISGYVSLSGAATSKEALEASENMKLDLAVEFIDVNVENVTVEVEPIEVSESVKIEFDVPEFALPKEVKEIGKIKMSSESKVSFAIAAKNVVSGLDIEMATLKLAFPKGMEVEGADANGVLVLAENVDLSSKYEGSFNIKSITPSVAAGGKVGYHGDVEVLVECLAEGTVQTKSLPSDPSKDMVIETKVNADLAIADCEIVTNTVSMPISTEPVEFVVEFPGEVADFGTFVVTPKGNPQVEINIDIPETSLDINMADDGLVIEIPKMLVLGDVDPSIKYDEDAHTITLEGALPPQIVLPVKELVVKPEKGEDGKYVAVGSMSVNGAVEISETEVSATELDELITKGISFSVNVPAMSADKISVEEFSFEVQESEKFTLFEAGTFPKEIVEISDVDIAETKLKISLSAENLPDFGDESAINVDIQVTLPEVIVPNELSLKGEIKDGKFEQEITIEDLDFSGVDLSADKDLEMEVSVTGGIYVTNPSIALDELSAEEVSLNLAASLSDIKVLKIAGKVDYSMGDINESISLEDVPELFKNDDFCLDIDNPRIVLDITSNIGLPIIGTLSLTPYKNGAIVQNANMEVDLALPYSESSDKVKTTTVWIAANNSGAPADAQFIEARLSNLIKALPDSIVVSISGGTDVTKPVVVETTADYILDLKYKLEIPMAFGEDMRFALSDEIDVTEVGIGDILKMGEIHLVGWIENALPLNFNVSIELLDGDGNVLATEPVSQSIAACKRDGSATQSPLNLKIAAKSGTDMTKLAKLKVDFEITSKNVSGVPITTESYIQAKLGLNLPKGITLNL